MTERLDLSGTWFVTWSDGTHGLTDIPSPGRRDPGRYLEVPVPRELHLALAGHGLVGDPHYGLNALAARWVEEQYWQYQTTFIPPAEALSGPAWLVFDQLDLAAEVYLNGEPVGTHANAHRPCRLNVAGRLRPGENELTVLVESGLHYVADREGAAYNTRLDSRLNKRHWLRKPQYQFGWDWSPRLINVGITGPVRLEWADGVRLDQAAVLVEPAEDLSRAAVRVRAYLEGLGGTGEAVLRARIAETGTETSRAVAVAPGIAPYELVLDLERPRLWWPRGHGEQALYTLELALEIDGATVDRAVRRFGVRSVRIDQPVDPEGGYRFILVVNGRPIFCRGGNWVPPDLIYSRIDRQRIDRLVDLAVAANFNLLRVWGGGCFGGHGLLEACDAAGLLVWHDFLFACAKYPGDDPAFLAEVRAETAWAAREFAHHPSLAVWCGNNELEVAAWEWGYDRTGRSLPDYALYHHVIPRILREEDPARPYWPSSPYSPDHRPAGEPESGDQHPWGVSLGQDGPDFWAYRRYADRFPNEGGFLGASSAATLRAFLPPGERRLRSFAWEYHDNCVNFWPDGAGVAYQAIDLWLGRDYQRMDLDEYAFASGLLQAEALTEYIANYRRRMFASSGAIFWMYNDSWPATHGWTIVDWYLRRKIAYHPVRRAFQPVTVVVADLGGRIGIFGVNDGPAAWRGALRFGFFGMRGGLLADARREAALPANSATMLAELDREEWERLGVREHGAFAILLGEDGAEVARHRLFLARFKDLSFAKPEIDTARDDGGILFAAPAFVWGACLDPDGEADLPDDCFDLLPGIPHRLPWPAGKDLPRVSRTGNDLILAGAGEAR